MATVEEARLLQMRYQLVNSELSLPDVLTGAQRVAMATVKEAKASPSARLVDSEPSLPAVGKIETKWADTKNAVAGAKWPKNNYFSLFLYSSDMTLSNEVPSRASFLEEKNCLSATRNKLQSGPRELCNVKCSHIRTCFPRPTWRISSMLAHTWRRFADITASCLRATLGPRGETYSLPLVRTTSMQ